MFKEIPAATWSLVRQVDTDQGFDQIRASFEGDKAAGVDSRGAARALQRLAFENGLRSWCYEFGDRDRFTHMVTLIEEDAALWLHDAYLGLALETDFLSAFERIERSEDVSIAATDDRRTYVADLSVENEDARVWLGAGEELGRGVRLIVQGGDALLAHTEGFQEVASQSGARPTSVLTSLMTLPVSLIGPVDGAADPFDLPERLGLANSTSDEAPAARLSGARNARSSLANRQTTEIARLAQEQLGKLLEQLTGERIRLTEDLANAMERHSDLRAALAEANSDKRHSSEALEAARSESRDLREANVKLQVERQAAADECQRLGNRLAQMKAEVDDAYGEAKRLEVALAEAQARASLNEQELQSSRDRLASMAESLASAESRAHAAEREIESVRPLIEQTAESLSEAEARAQASAAALDQLRSNSAAERANAEIEAHSMRRELLSLQEDVRNLAESLGTAEARERVQAEELDTLRAKTASQEELASRSALLEAEIAAIRHEAQRAGEAVAAADARTHEQESLIEHLRMELEQARAETRNIAEALEAAELRERSVAERTGGFELTAEDRTEEIEAEREGVTRLLSQMIPGSAADTRPDQTIATKGAASGCLCYGPYIDLAEGSYRLELDFQRSGPAALLPAKAMVEIVDGHRYLSSRQIKLGSGRQEAVLEFQVPTSSQPRQVEFRVIVGKRAFVTLTGVSLVSTGAA